MLVGAGTWGESHSAIWYNAAGEARAAAYEWVSGEIFGRETVGYL